MSKFLRALLCLAACVGRAQDLPTLPDGDRWMRHLTQELLPFWDMPSALGDPVGNFPSTRCDDGSTLDFQKPCPEIRGNYYLLTPVRYLVSVSRQTYGYGVAFHLTGDPRYLAYMRAGVDYIRANAIDRSGGGMLTKQDLKTGKWGPAREFRNPQELGYGLLGMAFYYYLTRDPDILPDLVAGKRYIFDNYSNSSLGTLQWMLQSNGSSAYDQRQLVAALDQMNTYLVLLAPILPEPYASEWKQTASVNAYNIIQQFFSQKDQLFFLAANKPADLDLAQSGTDFGHNAKALWMIRWTGLITGDADLVRFAEDLGPKLFARAYLQDQGAWAEGLLPGGAIDRGKSWWIYAELDQFAATLALKDSSLASYLPYTNNFYFDNFVDHTYGEVWTALDGVTNQPLHGEPKQWPWKNAYHSFEHALVGYITSQALAGKPVVLHYAFQELPDMSQIRPYYFSGDVDGGFGVNGSWAFTFTGVR